MYSTGAQVPIIASHAHQKRLWTQLFLAVALSKVSLVSSNPAVSESVALTGVVILTGFTLAFPGALGAKSA